MRANAIYLRRLHRRSQFACSDLSCVEPVASPIASVNGKQKEDPRQSGDPQELVPECEWEVAPSTRSVLKRVFSFFQLKNSISPPQEHPKPSSPAQPPKQPPNPRNRRKLYCPGESASDKENIPPLPKAPTAVSLLRSFRQQDQEERKQEQGIRPPRGIRPLSELKQFAHTETQERSRQFSKLSIKRADHRRHHESGSTSENRRPRKILRRSRRDNSTGDVYVTHKHFNKFSELIEDPLIQRFLSADVCRRYADKYLIAMVFTYFLRSRLQFHEYTKENFFAGLYLAHDMEEDEEELKYEVFPWILGRRWRKTYPTLLQKRDDIYWAIDCRAVVSKKCCDQVMDLEPEHWVWKRERPEYHGGALRDYLRHEDDNGHPRGPDKSPLQCQECLERQCLESENSYLLYMSDSDFSSDAKASGEGDSLAQNEKDSGFETFLCEAMDVESKTTKNNIPMENNAAPEEQHANLLITSPGKQKETNGNFICTNGDCEKACLSDDTSAYDFSVDSGEEMECQGNDSIGAINDEKIPLSQADTVSFHSGVQYKLSQEF
ncbi:uncharacterized protein LOC134773542 [Penaeus indicus]|uniref:uncharacterized protein LOC134773542 n=1 Tax=Penaeus indicus TaxID=29960 RepID=UPI00300D3EA1